MWLLNPFLLKYTDGKLGSPDKSGALLELQKFSPTQSGFVLRPKYWVVQQNHTYRTVNLISGTSGVQQFPVIPSLQSNHLLYREGGVSFISCTIFFVLGIMWNKSSKVRTYLLLSSVHIFSWLHTSSMPSGWPWHTHHTSSLSFLLTKRAAQKDIG